MRISTANKISALIITVLLFTIASSSVAMYLSWNLEQLLHDTVSKNLSSVRAAEELEIALLEQRGLVGSYFLDNGNRMWLDRLDEKKPSFHVWLANARGTAHTGRERRLLDRLEAVYEHYDGSRDLAIALYDEGRTEEATYVLLHDVAESYDQAFALCEDFLEANNTWASDRMAQSRHQVQKISWIVGALVLLCVTGSAALFWVFFMRIHYPLRRMVAELRDFASERDTPPTGSEVDEMSVMGDYLRTLMTDVSETSSTLLQSRRQLVQAEKLASVGKLAASVAHEIRNPLTAMNMWLFSIRRSIADDREVVRKLDAISEEMSRLEQVVQSFLEFTRPAELRLQQVRLDTILQNTIHLLQHRLAERQIVVNFVNVESLPTVTADPDQLKQVFINLIWNAAEAIEGEGEVTITGRVGNGQAVAETVELRIRDTGHGIGEEVRNRLFEPFFTTKEDGTGLGLSIAARILVRHGGRLWLESSGPTGSCFAMRIPVAVEVEHGPHSDRG